MASLYIQYFVLLMYEGMVIRVYNASQIIYPFCCIGNPCFCVLCEYGYIMICAVSLYKCYNVHLPTKDSLLCIFALDLCTTDIQFPIVFFLHLFLYCYLKYLILRARLFRPMDQCVGCPMVCSLATTCVVHKSNMRFMT